MDPSARTQTCHSEIYYNQGARQSKSTYVGEAARFAAGFANRDEAGRFVYDTRIGSGVQPSISSHGQSGRGMFAYGWFQKSDGAQPGERTM